MNLTEEEKHRMFLIYPGRANRWFRKGNQVRFEWNDANQNRSAMSDFMSKFIGRQYHIVSCGLEAGLDCPILVIVVEVD